MKILVLDNYDSFTYNLVHILHELGLGKQTDVIRNDQITLDAVDAYDHVLLSPGPGLPKDAGIMPDLIKRYSATKSIFGVCLGLQAIAEAFGGSIYNLPEVYHGIATDVVVRKKDSVIFKDIPEHFSACRYHSWAAVRESLPKELIITADDAAGVVMAIEHSQFKVYGVQFHPESILTEHGKKMIRNWLNA